jgi:tRNA (guanine37-N1)-methyltransferase
MHFDILTIFPQLFEAFRTVGLLGKAVERGVVGLEVHDLRNWADNKWRQLDDEPYGGGAGMVLQAPPVLAAVRQLQQGDSAPPRSLVLGPRGRVFDQAMARELADEDRIVLLCGRYEGFDERIFNHSRLEEVSIGDYVLGGGEVAAMVVVEAVSRLVEGVVGDPDSVSDDSFSCGLLDHPCFTRPAEVEGKAVPEVLLSGNHERIRRWRLQQAVELTVTRRPDLIKKSWVRYSDEIRELVRTVAPELADNAAEESTCRSS